MIFLPFFDFFCALAYFYLAFMVFQKNPRALQNKVYASFVFCFALWSMGRVVQHYPHSSREAVRWAVNISSLGWICFSSFFLWLGFILQGKKYQNKLVPFILFLLPAFMIYRQWTGNFISDFRPLDHGWMMVYKNPLEKASYFIYLSVVMVVGIHLIQRFLWRLGTDDARREARLLFVTAVPASLLCVGMEYVASEIAILGAPAMGHVMPLLWFLSILNFTRYQFRTVITPATAADNIFGTMSDALFLLSEENKIILVNKALIDMLGYEKNVFIGKPIDLFFTRSYASYFKTLVRENREIRSQEFQFKKKNGDFIPVLLSASILRDYPGEIAGLVCVATDISQRKEFEEELIRTYEKLQDTQIQLIHSEKMAGIGQLAAGVAHEINNPASFIISNLELARDYLNRLTNILSSVSGLLGTGSGLEEDALSKLRQSVEKIKQDNDFDSIDKEFSPSLDSALEGALRIKDIVSKLKTFSHPKQQFAFANVNDQITSAFDLVSNELKYNCSVHMDFGDLPEILCIPGQLTQVFVNLFMNSVQAIAAGKGVIDIKTYHEQKLVIVEFSDNGPGISRDAVNKIFDPFFTTKGLGKGTGLGLSIVYNIIISHGGAVEVESELGRGAKFIIQLPVPKEKD